MIIGGILKCILNMALMSIPALNLSGAAVATLECYLVVMGLEMAAFSKMTKIKIPIGEILVKPLCAGVLCGIAARTFYNISCLR
jgi:hypothetical protein